MNTGKATLPDHDHVLDTTAQDAANLAMVVRIANLEARVTKLEAPVVVVPPPVVPPPVVTGTTVPATIDATGATGVSAALNAWIKSQPDGSTLIFPSGATYRLDGDAGINLTGRKRLTLVGTGCTLLARTTGVCNFSSSFFLQASEDIIVRGFAVDGGNAATGTLNAKAQVNEKLNAAVIRGDCKRVEFDHVRWDNTRGFGPLISSDGGTAWPEDISIHDCFIRGGEMGVGIVSGRRVKIERNTIADSLYIAIDLEPDSSQVGGGGFVDVLLSANTIDGYGWGQTLTSWFVAANPQDAVVGTAVMDGLTITGNTVVRGAVGPANGSATGLGGLGIRADKANVKRDLVISNNTTAVPDTRASTRATMNLAAVEDLTVTGNRQPAPSGAKLLTDTGTTGTRIVSGNVAT